MKRKKQKRNPLPAARRLRCFVAMWIGDPETDAVYDRLIAPTIRRVGLAPRRIDRLMHNERIDQRILAELHAAHVVVADLTFARPSVYWEAGYAEARGTPVVYTCQRGHFRPRAGDRFGNFKVHFDLQTKNIIPWVGATDRRSRKALEKRLRYVLRPILQERAKGEARKREEEVFAALPMAERRRRAVDMAIHQARRVGFRGRRQDADTDDARFLPRWFSVAQYAARLARAAHTGLVVAVPKLSKSALREIRDQLTRGPLDDKRAKEAKAQRKTVVDHGIVVSFTPVSPAMVAETLPSFQRDLRTPWLAWSSAVVPDWSTAGVPRRKVKVHILSNIRSEPQAREAMKQMLLGIGLPRR